MRKKSGISLPAVGISSLIVIFAVLCLTVFALLSISTARSQQRLADSMKAAVTGYYQADNAAEEILAALRRGEQPECVTRNGDIYTYACPISGTQMLAVSVRIEGETYTVLQWQAVSTTDWEADDRLPVWGGEGT